MKKKRTIEISHTIPSFDNLIDDSYIVLVEGDTNKRTPKRVKDAVTKLQELARKYRKGLGELQDAQINLQQEMIIADPIVYVARTKDIKTEIEYFTAKTTWPIEGGGKKEIKIYLGKANEFGNNTKSEKARELAVRKMKETLRRRKDLGEI